MLAALDALQQREARVLARLPLARRIEYAFRRLPASESERRILRLLIEQEPTEQGGALHRAEAPTLSSSWHRLVGDICRIRRHLLSMSEPPQDAQPANGPGAWAAALLSIDDGDGDDAGIRLRPEAITAFSSLGYLGEASGAAAA